MEIRNDLLMKDAEIERQMFLVFADLYDQTKEKAKDDYDDVLCAAVPSLEYLINQTEEGIKKLVKSEKINPIIRNNINRAKLKLNKVGKVLSIFYEGIKSIISGYEFKKEFLSPQMKKINEFLLKHNFDKFKNIKYFKFGIGVLDIAFTIFNIVTIWKREDLFINEKIEKIKEEIFGLIGGTILGCIGVKIAANLPAPFLIKLLLIFILDMHWVSLATG